MTDGWFGGGMLAQPIGARARRRGVLSICMMPANGWYISPMPEAPASTMYLYARTLRAGHRYFVLVGEHVRNAINASYISARLF